VIRYTFAYGSYYVVEGERILNMVDEPSLLFTKEDSAGEEMWCLHRHGNFDKLMPYYQKLLQAWRSEKVFTEPPIKGMPETYNMNMFGKPYIITGKFEVDDLNLVLNNNNYLKELINKLNICLE